MLDVHRVGAVLLAVVIIGSGGFGREIRCKFMRPF